MSPQNEPTCCAGYPSMQWNAQRPGLLHRDAICCPALHAAGLSTKVLIHDWNWDGYDTWAAPLMNDTAIRNDSLFGGIAWHGYGGDVSEQTTMHNQFPSVARVRHRALRRHLDREPAERGHEQHHQLHPELG